MIKQVLSVQMLIIQISLEYELIRSNSYIFLKILSYFVQ